MSDTVDQEIQEIELEGRKEDEAFWCDEIRAAKVGDVVVVKDIEGFRHVLIVHEPFTGRGLWGDRFLADKTGKVFSITLSGGAVQTLEFTGVADLQVVSLG